MKNGAPDLRAKLVGLVVVALKRGAVDHDSVGQDHAVSRVSLVERNSNIEAVESRTRRGVHFSEVVRIWRVLDHDCDIFEPIEQRLRKGIDRLIDKGLEFR